MGGIFHCLLFRCVIASPHELKILEWQKISPTNRATNKMVPNTGNVIANKKYHWNIPCSENKPGGKTTNKKLEISFGCGQWKMYIKCFVPRLCAPKKCTPRRSTPSSLWQRRYRYTTTMGWWMNRNKLRFSTATHPMCSPKEEPNGKISEEKSQGKADTTLILKWETKCVVTVVRSIWAHIRWEHRNQKLKIGGQMPTHHRGDQKHQCRS